jgi:hypothetical protein
MPNANKQVVRLCLGYRALAKMGTPASIPIADRITAQQALAQRIRLIIERRFDAHCAVRFLNNATDGDFHLCGGSIRRALLGDGLNGDLDVIVPNGDNRAIEELDALGLTFVLNSHGHHRYRWNSLQIDIFEPRHFFHGFDDVENALRFFDLKVNALTLHVATGRILDPFHVLADMPVTDPGINWPRWTRMGPLDRIVLAIRLVKVMHEAPAFRISIEDARRLQDEVLPHVRACHWESVRSRFPQGKDEFLRVFASNVLARTTDAHGPR